jgi:hypothetical protein
MQLTVAQKHLLQSLNRGWPDNLLAQLLPRCGATEDEWKQLINHQLIQIAGGRWYMTASGLRKFHGRATEEQS